MASDTRRYDPPLTEQEARRIIAQDDGWLADQINWRWDDGGHFGGPGRLVVTSIHFSKAAYETDG